MRDKTFYWRGRDWTIRALESDEADETLGFSTVARIESDRALIQYRATMGEDRSICAILHEVGHEMFPEWSNEPNETSLSELGIFERDMKAFCDAVGIDLSPLLVGDREPEARPSRKRKSTKRR